MSAARYLPERDYRRLKIGTRDLIDANGGGPRAATKTRVGQQRLSKCASEEQDHELDFITLDVIADLEADCGRPVVTRVLAEICGYALVPMPEAVRSGTIGRLTGEAMAETGEMFVRLAKALEDRKITPAERRDFDREADEVIAAVMALKAQVRAEAEGGDE